MGQIANHKVPSFRMSLNLILLALFIFSIPFFSIYRKEGIIRPDWIAGGLLIVVFILRFLIKPRLGAGSTGYWVLALNFAAVLSALNLIDASIDQRQEFLTAWLQLIFASLLFFAIASMKIYRHHLRILLKLWIVLAFVISAYGIYQAFARNLGWPLAYVPLLNPTDLSPSQLSSGLGFGGYIRPSSILREPSYLGMYLVPPLMIMGILLLLKQDREWLFQKRAYNRVIFATMLLAFVLAFSLSAYLTMLGIFLALLVDWRLRAIRGAIVFVSVIMMGLAFTMLSEMPFMKGVEYRLERVFIPLTQGEIERGEMDTSAHTRLTEAGVAFRVWLTSPLYGVGLNSVEFAVLENNIEVPLWFIYAGRLERGYVHNMWLQALAEMGLLGFFSMLGIYFSLLRQIRRNEQSVDQTGKALLRGFFYVLVADMIRGFMGGTYFHTFYWFNLAFACLVLHLVHYPSKSSEEKCAAGVALRTI